ncbi:MAG: hypothetical protein U1F57_06850 [bacterium]
MLSSIQKSIETTYGIRSPWAVEAFLIDESQRGAFAEKIPWLKNSSEALLISQDEEEVELGLLFDSKLLEWSEAHDWETLVSNTPLLSLPLQKIGALIEGVSHFVYLTWRAEQDRAVTQLELELQAEVDKFVLLLGDTSVSERHEFFHRLFSETPWRPDLNSAEKERYETAMKLATRYCHHLKSAYSLAQADAWLPEVRSFYRKSQVEKIRHIHS